MNKIKRHSQKKREESATHLVKVLRNGQVILPKLLRDKLGLSVGDYLEIAVVDGTIVLRPVKFANPSKKKRTVTNP